MADTRRRLEVVPSQGRAGEWPALVRRHREMLTILEENRVRLGTLDPPPELLTSYATYLTAVTRQLTYERVVLNAAEQRDMAVYRSACTALARELEAVRRAGVATRLPALATPAGSWLRLGLTFPYHLWRAVRHSRAERRAGRSWT